MYEPFKYSKIMEVTSPLIYQWGIKNSVFFFDFDELMFQKDAELNLRLTLSQVKEQGYKLVAVVECHPFFKPPAYQNEIYELRNRQLNEVLEMYNLKSIFLTADWKMWQTEYSNQTFFPAWFFRLRAYALEHGYKEYIFPTNRKYNFSCCNFSNLRPEKIHNYLRCFTKRRSDWYLTIYDHPRLAISKLDINELPGFTAEDSQVWNNEICPALKPYEYDLLNGELLNAFSTIFAGHTDAYCNLVVEHSSEIEIASEKSFKPFIAEQIPVYSGQKGITRFIESLGFDVFTDFIDYAIYDDVEFYLDRINALHQEIDRLYITCNPTDFVKRPDVVKRLKRNRELFYSNQIDLLTISYLDRLLTN